jgi:hypothetical protein
MSEVTVPEVRKAPTGIALPTPVPCDVPLKEGKGEKQSANAMRSRESMKLDT